MNTFHNRTRSSASIPARLIRERHFHLLPIYYLLLTSDLAREGIASSASYRFADHVYAGRATGRYGIGYLLDAIFLRLPSARAMRYRCTAATDEIVRVVDAQQTGKASSVLAVPCGLARELFAAAENLSSRPGYHPGMVRWHGLDLDADLVAQLQRHAQQVPHDMMFRQGDALDPRSYGDARYTMIVSTGFTEFLSDEEVVRFFEIVRRHLHREGVFFTSAMLPHRVSDYLLRTVGEIHTHYRSAEHISSLIKAAGFERCATHRDSTGLQTIALARI
jgi:Putative methyltransferase